MPSADIRVNALVPPQNVVINAAANFSNASTGGEVTFAWTLLDQPEGPPDALVPAGPTAALTPLKEGSYLVQLVVNSGTNTEARDIAKIDVRNFIDGRSYPAAGETVEQNLTRGWAEEANRRFGARTSIRKDPGQVTGVIAVNGTTANQTVLFISGTVEIKATLPGAERVPLFDIANGSSTTEMAGSLFLLTKSVTNTAAPSAPVANDVIWARADGMVYGANLGGGALGDAVYVSNAGALALTPGTIGRSVGQIVAVRGAQAATPAGIAHPLLQPGLRPKRRRQFRMAPSVRLRTGPSHRWSSNPGLGPRRRDPVQGEPPRPLVAPHRMVLLPRRPPHRGSHRLQERGRDNARRGAQLSGGGHRGHADGLQRGPRRYVRRG